MADDNKGIVMGTAGLNPASLFAATREVFKASGAPTLTEPEYRGGVS